MNWRESNSKKKKKREKHPFVQRVNYRFGCHIEISDPYKEEEVARLIPQLIRPMTVKDTVHQLWGTSDYIQTLYIYITENKLGQCKFRIQGTENKPIKACTFQVVYKGSTANEQKVMA